MLAANEDGSLARNSCLTKALVATSRQKAIRSLGWTSLVEKWSTVDLLGRRLPRQSSLNTGSAKSGEMLCPINVIQCPAYAESERIGAAKCPAIQRLWLRE